MPRLDLSGSPNFRQSLPPAALLADDEHGFFYDLGMGLLEGIDYISSDFLANLAGGKIAVPFTGKSFDFWGDEFGTMGERLENWRDVMSKQYGMEAGFALSELEGRAGQAALWAGAGLVSGGPIGAAILGGLGAIVPPPEDALGLIGTGLDIGTDPFVWSKFAKIGKVVQNPVFRGAKAKFSPDGWKEYLKMRKLPAVQRIATKFGDDAAVYRAEELVLERFRTAADDTTGMVVERAEKAGMLDRGGIKVGLPWMGELYGAKTIPGTPELFSAIGKRVAPIVGPIVQPIKKAFNVFDPALEDIKYVSGAVFRHTTHRSKKAVQNIQDAVNKAVVDEGLPAAFTMDTLTKVVDSSAALGVDEALKRLAPGLHSRHKETIGTLIDTWRKEYDDALKFIESKGGHADQLDLALRRQKIARENILAQAIDNKQKLLRKDAAGRLKGIDESLASNSKQRQAVGEKYYQSRVGVYKRLYRDEGQLAHKGFKPPKVAKVPTMITKKMRQQLKDFGYSDDAIRKMKPQEAWDELAKHSDPRSILETGVSEDIERLALQESEELAKLDRADELLELQAQELKIVTEIRERLADSGMDLTKPKKGSPLAKSHKASSKARAAFGRSVLSAKSVANKVLRMLKDLGDFGEEAMKVTGRTADDILKFDWDGPVGKRVIDILAGPFGVGKGSEFISALLKARRNLSDAKTMVDHAATKVADEAVAGVKKALKGDEAKAARAATKRAAGTAAREGEEALDDQLASASRQLDETQEAVVDAALETGEVQLEQIRRQLQNEISAIGKAIQEAPGYVPRFASEEFGAFGKAMSQDGALYEKVIDTLTERLTNLGSAFTEVGGLTQALDYPALARSMVKNLVNRTLGTQTGGGGAKVSARRALQLEIMTEGPGGKMIGSNVFRSMRADELEPLIKEMEKLMGETMFRYSKTGKALATAGRVVTAPIKTATYPIRSKLFGREKASAFLKLRTPKVFETDPIMQTARYYEYLQEPLAKAAGYKRLIKDFGRKASKQDMEALKSGELKGFDLIDDIKGLENHLFPSHLVPDIRRWNKHWTSDDSVSGVLAVFDAVQGWWKRQALISPAYHTRNFISGLWQGMHIGNIRSPMAYLEALNLQLAIGRFGAAKDKPLTWWKRLRLWKDETIKTVNGETYSYKQLYDMAVEDGVLGPGFFEYESGIIGGYIKKGVRGGVTEVDRALFKANAVAGQKVEETLRLAQYIDGLKKGMGRTAIAKEVGYTHFLYQSDLSKLETRWLKRIFPFWSWARFNIPRSLLASLQHPGRPAVVRHILEDLESRDDMPTASLQPDWVRKAFGVRYKKEAGKDHYFFLGAWWPVADVAKLMAYPLATFQDLLTPAIKMPIELGTGRRIGSDRPLEQFEGQKGQMYVPPGFGWMYGTGALGGNVAFDRSTLHMMRTFRVLNELDKVLGPSFQDVTPSRRESIETLGGRMYNMLLGARYYILDRERAAGGVKWRNELEIGNMKSWYMRSLAAGDGPNRDSAWNWLRERGIAPPSDKEYQSFLKRRARGKIQRKKEVRQLLEAVPPGGF